MFPVQSISTCNVCAAQKRSKHGRDPYHVMWRLFSARMMTSRDETAPSVGGKVLFILDMNFSEKFGEIFLRESSERIVGTLAGQIAGPPNSRDPLLEKFGEILLRESFERIVGALAGPNCRCRDF
ncbi:hypothetical protein CEXT_326671 [Caerostris extrusa]|uniref:Uncharacterized protein n=1 Tax=Caerostris extrusa TaxID=172846 RepID=A0AAV4N987_CAEEX|nr:hypothetical protein CEXT_326671 [Caerostris extrusa]